MASGALCFPCIQVKQQNQQTQQDSPTDLQSVVCAGQDLASGSGWERVHALHSWSCHTPVLVLGRLSSSIRRGETHTHIHTHIEAILQRQTQLWQAECKKVGGGLGLNDCPNWSIHLRGAHWKECKPKFSSLNPDVNGKVLIFFFNIILTFCQLLRRMQIHESRCLCYNILLFLFFF